MCNLHYQRWAHHGTTEPIIIRNGPRLKYPQEYKSWEGMKHRCYTKSCKQYKWYGAKGVKVCDRWLGAYGFPNFLKDMGPKPSHEMTASGSRPIYSLDRIDPNGDYCPENCRWVNTVTQASNKGNSAEYPGVHRQNRLWVARLRTSAVNIAGSFPTKEMAIEAREDWVKKYSPR